MLLNTAPMVSGGVATSGATTFKPPGYVQIYHVQNKHKGQTDVDIGIIYLNLYHRRLIKMHGFLLYAFICLWLSVNLHD